MSVLIVTVILGSVIAYFATQNTGLVSIIFVGYILTIPLYFVVVGSLLVGLFLSWIISLVSSISSSLTIHGKESKIKETQKEVVELTKRIHELELENTRLKTESGEPLDDKSL